MKLLGAVLRSCVLAPWIFATLASAQGGSYGWLPGYVNSAGSCNVTSEGLANYVACLNVGLPANSAHFSVTNNNTNITYGTGLYAAPFSLSNYGATSFPGMPLNGNSSWSTSETPYNCTLACRAHGMKYSMMIVMTCNCSPYITYSLYYNEPTNVTMRPDLVYFASATHQNSSCVVGNYAGFLGCYGDNKQTDCGWNTTTDFSYGLQNLPLGMMGATTFVDITFASDSTLNLATQATSYAYLACFILSSTTTSFIPLGFSNNFATPNQCYTFCAGVNMPYAGMTYQAGSLPVYCTCGTEFAPGSYQYLPDINQCNRDCSNGSQTTCIGGQNCCGNGNYYAVYRNPNLLGCYEPPIPGTSLAGTPTYPVACFSTVCPLSTASLGSYVNPNPVAVYTPTNTPIRQHQWIVPGYSQFTYIGCYNMNILTSTGSTITDTMQPSICAAYCASRGKYFSLSMNNNQNLNQYVVCTCGNTIGAYQPQLPFSSCNFECMNAVDGSTLCGGRFNITSVSSGSVYYGNVLAVAVYGPPSVLSTIHRTIYPTSTYSCHTASTTSTPLSLTSASNFLTCFTPTPTPSTTLLPSSSSSETSSTLSYTQSTILTSSSSSSSSSLSILNLPTSSSSSATASVLLSSSSSSSGPLGKSSASVWSVPTTIPYVVPGDANYVVSGVYSNQNGNLLNGTPGVWLPSVEVCLAYCDIGAGNYAYAGMDYLGECHCGSGLNLQSGSPGDEPATSPPTPPQIGPCVGNPNEYCGASMYQLVYSRRSNPLTSGNILNPWQAPGDGNYTFNSIWSDPTNQSPFVTAYGGASVTVYGLLDLDIQNCLSTCENLSPQWQYAGLENGNQCWCGDGLNLAANTNLTGTPGASAANVSCVGNPYELCGGVSVMAVYSLATYTSSSIVSSSTIFLTSSSLSSSSSLVLTRSSSSSLVEVVSSLSPTSQLLSTSIVPNPSAAATSTLPSPSGLLSLSTEASATASSGFPSSVPVSSSAISRILPLPTVSGSSYLSDTLTTTGVASSISSIATATASTSPGDSYYQFLNCYDSGTNCTAYHELTEYWDGGNQIDVDTCLQYCEAGAPQHSPPYAGLNITYQYAILEFHGDANSDWCFCTNFFPKYIGGPVLASKCNMPCVGNPSEFCGGYNPDNSTWSQDGGPNFADVYSLIVPLGTSSQISSTILETSNLASSLTVMNAGMSSPVSSTADLASSSGLIQSDTTSTLSLLVGPGSSTPISSSQIFSSSVTSSFSTIAAAPSSLFQSSSTITLSSPTVVAAPSWSIQSSSQIEGFALESSATSSSPKSSGQIDSSSSLAGAPSSTVQTSSAQSPRSSPVSAGNLLTSTLSAQITSSSNVAAVASSSVPLFSSQVMSSIAVEASLPLTAISSTVLESSSNVGAAATSSAQSYSSQSTSTNNGSAAPSVSALSSSLVASNQITSSSNEAGMSGISGLSSAPVSSSLLTSFSDISCTTSSSPLIPSTQMSSAMSSTPISSSQMVPSTSVTITSSAQIYSTLASSSDLTLGEHHVCPTVPPGFLFSTSAAGALCVATTISWYPDCTPLPSTS